MHLTITHVHRLDEDDRQLFVRLEAAHKRIEHKMDELLQLARDTNQRTRRIMITDQELSQRAAATLAKVTADDDLVSALQKAWNDQAATTALLVQGLKDAAAARDPAAIDAAAAALDAANTKLDAQAVILAAIRNTPAAEVTPHPAGEEGATVAETPAEADTTQPTVTDNG